jgi:hypothetical protein
VDWITYLCGACSSATSVKAQLIMRSSGIYTSFGMHAGEFSRKKCSADSSEVNVRNLTNVKIENRMKHSRPLFTTRSSERVQFSQVAILEGFCIAARSSVVPRCRTSLLL